MQQLGEVAFKAGAVFAGKCCRTASASAGAAYLLFLVANKQLHVDGRLIVDAPAHADGGGIAPEHQAGLFVWAELPESYEGDSFAFSDEVMDKCDVFLTPGGIFGSEGKRYIRITLCCPEELLKKATENIKAKFGK